MTETAPIDPGGIRLITLPHDDQRTVNAILIEGTPLTLVDVGLGTDASLAALRQGLAALGYQLEQIEQIVITHAHLDHFGAAAAVVRASGARVLGDAGGLTEMATFREHFSQSQRYRLDLYRQAGAPEEVVAANQRWGEHYARQGEPVVCDAGLAPGDELQLGGARWQVLAVPGHAASSIALYDPEHARLLSGDILVGIGAANVTLHRVGDGRLPAGWQLTIMASLDRLLALPLRRVYPGHGRTIDTPLQTLVDRQQRTEARLRQVRALLAAEPLTAYELAQRLYQPPVSTSGLGLSQALGYADALECAGLASVVTHAGRRRYRASEA